MTDRDPTPDGFILEIHLVDGKVVHAPHTLVEAREAFAIIASEAPWLKRIADERAALAIGLGTGYRRLLASGGGIVIGDDQHGYWNLSEGSILALCWRQPCVGMNRPVMAALNGDVDSGWRAAG